MAKLFIFGIGGTGSRVIKALTMLLASGVKLNNSFDTIIPVLIDPDTANGDLNRTKEILSLYQQIRNKIHHPTDFFKQELKTINNLTNNDDTVDADNFQFSLENVAQNTFKDYIGFPGMNNDFNTAADDKNFVRLLYSNVNLESNLNIGFQGNPNMGSIVLNQFTNSDNFQLFQNSFADGDAVFIINSIFGGTGAAGFPLLLKTLRSSQNNLIATAKIGNMTFLPYFNLSPEGAINSDTFMGKAKIALEYYNRTIINQNSINAIYFIGNNNNQTLKNHPGGNDQKNDAHFLELAGSLSIIDFINNINNFNAATATQVKEFGIINNTNTITFDDIDPNSKSIIEKPLTKYKLFHEYIEKGLDKAIKYSKWTKSNMFLITKSKQSLLDEQYFMSSDFKNEIKRFNSYFDEWLSEMNRNQTLAFSPFNEISSDNAMSVIQNRPPKGIKSFYKIDQNNCKLIEKQHIRNNADKKHTVFIKMFSESIERACNKCKIF